MGQKVNPNGFRINITHSWPSMWFAGNKKKYREAFLHDVKIKRHIRDTLKDAGISLITIDRGKKVTVVITTSKPGVVIGKQGSAIEDIRKDLERRFGGSFEVQIQEVRNPDADAEVIAETVQGQIHRRMPYRRACKMAIEKAMQAGALGVKIRVSGRLNGAEISRSEYFKDGNVPLQTLRANVNRAVRHAWTKFGTTGVQVWVYHGMVFKKIQQMQSSGLSTPRTQS